MIPFPNSASDSTLQTFINSFITTLPGDTSGDNKLSIGDLAIVRGQPEKTGCIMIRTGSYSPICGIMVWCFIGILGSRLLEGVLFSSNTQAIRLILREYLEHFSSVSSIRG
jgi:hypothetical protein